MLAQLLRTLVAKMCPRGRLWPLDYCLPGPCLRGPYYMAEHNHMYKRFKSLHRSLRIAYDFRNDLKILLNVYRVCCPWNEQIR